MYTIVKKRTSCKMPSFTTVVNLSMFVLHCRSIIHIDHIYRPYSGSRLSHLLLNCCNLIILLFWIIFLCFFKLLNAEKFSILPKLHMWIKVCNSIKIINIYVMIINKHCVYIINTKSITVCSCARRFIFLPLYIVNYEC